MDGDATEWDAICRICLQEGEMHSIFDSYVDSDNYDADEVITVANKIMLCSPIEIKQGMNMPEQICTTCLNKLEVAYAFRQSCERSDAILQSFIENDTAIATTITTEYTNDRSVIVNNSESGTVYKYKPPDGLNIKRVRPEPIETNELIIKSEPCSDNELEIEMSDESQSKSYRKVIRHPIRKNVAKQQKTMITVPSYPLDEEVVGDTETVTYETVEELLPIKTVRTNKVRLGINKKSNTNEIDKATANGSTLKNVRPVRSRQLKEQKAPKVCEICGNTYKYQHALESHMRRHRNEKPFECLVCGKGFVINFELNRHMRTHTGQKPYACKYCDRRFSDFGSRVKHERTHTGERPYACETCGKTFTYSHVLSSHNLIHTGEKKYHCEICGKRFAKSHHLKAHLNTHAKQSLALQGQSDGKSSAYQRKERQSATQALSIATMTATDVETTDGSIDQYIISDVIPESEDVDDGEQLLMYGDVDVLTEYKPSHDELEKMDKTEYVEDENGIQHEITIEEQQDAIELLTFEDDQLE